MVLTARSAWFTRFSYPVSASRYSPFWFLRSPDGYGPPRVSTTRRTHGRHRQGEEQGPGRQGQGEGSGRQGVGRPRDRTQGQGRPGEVRPEAGRRERQGRHPEVGGATCA